MYAKHWALALMLVAKLTLALSAALRRRYLGKQKAGYDGSMLLTETCQPLLMGSEELKTLTGARDTQSSFS